MLVHFGFAPIIDHQKSFNTTKNYDKLRAIESPLLMLNHLAKKGKYLCNTYDEGWRAIHSQLSR